MAEVADRKRSPIMLIVEVFSIITAMAFVYSATMGAILFWSAYNVNYFLIATPADVVMSGFMVLGLTAMLACWIIALIVFWIVISNHFIRRIVESLPDTENRRQGLEHYRTFLHEIKFFVASWKFIALASTSLLLMTAVSIAIEGHEKRSLPDFLQTGLRLTDPDAPAACQDGAVEWMGSNAAIVRCGDRVMVIRDAAKLTMEPA